MYVLADIYMYWYVTGYSIYGLRFAMLFIFAS